MFFKSLFVAFTVFVAITFDTYCGLEGRVFRLSKCTYKLFLLLTTSVTVVCEWSLVTTMNRSSGASRWPESLTDDGQMTLRCDYGLMSVAVIKQSRTVYGVTQVVDRDDG